MRSLLFVLLIVGFAGSEFVRTAEGCNRCGRSACLYVKPVVAAVAAPVQSITQTDVYVVQNNAATPLVAQGTSAIVSNGGYQSQVLPLFDPNRYVSQRLELQKAVNATGAIENERTSNLVERLVALQAPAVERLAAGQAAQMVLNAAGLSEPNQQAQSSAVVITNRNGVIQTMQLAPDQVQALTSQITTTTSKFTQSITTTPAAPLAQVQGKYPMLTQFCGKCHGIDVAQPKGGLYLGDDPNVVKEMRAKWFNVTDAVSSGSMPPATAPQPTQEQKVALLNEMQAIIKAAPQ